MYSITIDKKESFMGSKMRRKLPDYEILKQFYTDYLKRR